MKRLILVLSPMLGCPAPVVVSDAGWTQDAFVQALDAGRSDLGSLEIGPREDTGPPPVLPPAFQERWVTPLADESSASPLATDLNGDGNLDLVLGTGTEAARGSIEALSGVNGGSLWRSTEAGESLFTLGLEIDLNLDGTNELVIGGRGAELLAIDASTGGLIWNFEPRGNAAREAGYFNFYTPQALPDLDGDEIPELLLANGGDARAAPFAPRPPGHLMILSGDDGRPLRQAVMPDQAETYLSPLWIQREPLEASVIIFGSGGETLPGSLWKATMGDLMQEDLSRAVELMAPASHKGFIAPPAIVDLNGDGQVEVVAASFDGRIAAIQLDQGEELWSHSLADAETQASPAIGYLDGDEHPDVLALFCRGTYPHWNGVELLAISGHDGRILYQHRFENTAVPSPLLVDLNRDGLDEAILILNPVIDEGPQQQVDQRILLLAGGTGERHELAAHPGTSVGTPLVQDLDGDGHYEMVFTRSGRRGLEMVLWDLDAPVAQHRGWPGYLGPHGTGRFTPSAR